ncbi:hypothetical protein F5Y11DRAFT_341498, partial [Daldinia sp. FL1419]
RDPWVFFLKGRFLAPSRLPQFLVFFFFFFIKKKKKKGWDLGRLMAWHGMAWHRLVLLLTTRVLIWYDRVVYDS